ncbi:hypothetical protein Pfo_031512, partial [Paulownia fortunei]
MSSGDSSANGHKDVETRGQNLDSASRRMLYALNFFNPIFICPQARLRSNFCTKKCEGKRKSDLLSRPRNHAQEKEIQYLREQIALASIRESQLLNEKYTLERKFSELRMALDEKQSEVITSASNELAQRKGDLEVNLNLLNELK